MAGGTVCKGRHCAPGRSGLTLQLSPTGNVKRIALPLHWLPTSLSTAVEEGSMPREACIPLGYYRDQGWGRRAVGQDICHSYYCCPGRAANKHIMSRDPTLPHPQATLSATHGAAGKSPEKPCVPHLSVCSWQEGCFSPSHSNCNPWSPSSLAPRSSSLRLCLVLSNTARSPQLLAS